MDLKKIKNSAVPPMVMIGIVPEHYSYELIKESGEFVINVPSKGFEKEYYYLGTKSGRDEGRCFYLNTINRPQKFFSRCCFKKTVRRI